LWNVHNEDILNLYTSPNITENKLKIRLVGQLVAKFKKKKDTGGQVAHRRKPKNFSQNVGQKTERPKVHGEKAPWVVVQ